MTEQDDILSDLGKLEDIKELDSLIKQQKLFEKSLKLLYNHCDTKGVKEVILKRTGQLAQSYQDWANSTAWEDTPNGSRTPKSLAIAIDGAKTVIAFYETLFDELDTIAPYLKDSGKASDQKLNLVLSAINGVDENIASFVKLLQNRDKTKPADSLDYEVAVTIMKGICGSDAVSERTIRDWITRGQAAKVDLKISFDDLRNVQTWTAWCHSYFALMTNRLKTKISLSEVTQKPGDNRK